MYASRALKPHEARYHQYELEALAVVWGCAVYRPYVLGSRFKVITDNKALFRLMSRPQQSRVVRWTLALQEYDIEWQHRTASKHGDADGLTRMCQVPPDFSFTKGDEVDALFFGMDTGSVSDHMLNLVEQVLRATPAPQFPQVAHKRVAEECLAEMNALLCTLPPLALEQSEGALSPVYLVKRQSGPPAHPPPAEGSSEEG